jgi:hypothetical protein
MSEASHPAVPPRSRLRLRPAPYIVLGFTMGPAAGLTALWMLMLLYTILDPGRAQAGQAVGAFVFFYVFLLLFGGIVCLAFELVFVTPLLLAFRRRRWRWLNGGTAVLIGFSLAFAPALLIGVLLPGPPNQTVWRMPTMVDCHRTLAGWLWMLVGCATVGVVGLVAAGVFRLVAVEVDPEGAAP